MELSSAFGKLLRGELAKTNSWPQEAGGGGAGGGGKSQGTGRGRVAGRLL